jgi:hypothetical protein
LGAETNDGEEEIDASVESEVQSGLTADSLGAGVQAPEGTALPSNRVQSEGTARPSKRLRDINRGDHGTPQLAGPDDVLGAEADNGVKEIDALGGGAWVASRQ